MGKSEDKRSFLFMESWTTLFESMPSEEAGDLIKAVCAFSRGEKPNIENPLILAMFNMIAKQMIENEEKYKAKCEKQAEYGRIGSAKRWDNTKKKDPIANDSYPISENSYPIANDGYPINSDRGEWHKEEDKEEDKEEEEDREEEKDKKTKTVSHSSLRSECSVPETGFGDSENVPPDEKIPVEREQTNYKAVVDSYNSLCKSFPKVTKLSERRRKAIRARLKEYSLAEIEKAFALAEESEFLKGANNRNWMASFDWIISDSNLPKVLEGKYANRASPNGTSGKSQSMFGDDDFVAKVIRGETSLAKEGWFNGMGKVVDERGNPA